MIPSQVRTLLSAPGAGADRPCLFALDGFDRRPQLLGRERDALAAMDLRALRRQRAHGGIPRRTAVHWKALTRLVAPSTRHAASFTTTAG